MCSFSKKKDKRDFFQKNCCKRSQLSYTSLDYRFSFLSLAMKQLIKKLLCYDKLYPLIKDSLIYHLFKKVQARIAALLYGNPANGFFIIGVTGTNGKTTTVNLLHKIFNDHVAPTVSISTADIRIGNKKITNTKKMTSLDVFDLQSLLSTAKNNGCKIAVLETSSHGLEQQRFAGIDFDVAVLTNITHDHLDYHGGMEAYAESKKLLFKNVLSNTKQNKIWVFPADDSYGRKRFEEMPFDKKLNYSRQASSILKATQIIEHLDHTEFVFSYLGKLYRSSTKLLWAYNVNNILAAIAVAIQVWLDISTILPSVEAFEGVEGRLQAKEVRGVHCFVDFAHTPDALEKTLSFLAGQKGEKKLITVFGCPGNRDKEKRPIMWEIARKYSDIAICTDDDPSTESRLKILDDISKPLQEKLLASEKSSYVIPERRYAIQLAMELAQPWDLLVLAGKGHETIQLTNFGKRAWNDYQMLSSLA